MYTGNWKTNPDILKYLGVEGCSFPRDPATTWPPRSLKFATFELSFGHSRNHHIMSIHLPIRRVRLLRRQCLFQRPYICEFSTTDSVRKKVTTKAQATPSPGARQLETLSDAANIPEDFGILTGSFGTPTISIFATRMEYWPRDIGTFIRAPWYRLPVKNPKQWLQYEWKFLVSKVKAYFSYERTCWISL